MADGASRHSLAAVAATGAAFLWAAYYFFVLAATPTAAPVAILAYPFLFGGAAYAVLAAYEGHLRALVRLWASPSAYGRTALLVGMQVTVLASTYAAGSVDTSLLSLLGDVALTPVLLMVIWAEGRDRLRSVPFVLGLVLGAVGASLTIVGGQTAPNLSGWAWLVAPGVPLTVAFYFLATARANLRLPPTAVVGQSMLAAGGVGLLLAPALPGGWGGLAVPGATTWVLLAALGVTSFFLAPWLYFRAITWTGLMLPALLMSGIPVFTLALSVALVHQVPDAIGLVGVPVAVVGALLALRGTRPTAGGPPAGGPEPA